jgi:hypothetical protein
MAADRNVVPPARLCSRSSGGAHARPQNQPRRPQSTSLTDGSEASGAEGAWYKDFGSFKLCGEGPLSENILAGGAGGHGAEALTEHSRLITNPAEHSTAPATVTLPWTPLPWTPLPWTPLPWTPLPWTPLPWTPLVLGSQHPSI